MWGVVFAYLGAVGAQDKVPTAPASCLRFERAFELPKVEGRLGHMAFWDLDDISEAYGHLFIAAPENGSLELIDVKHGHVRDPYMGPQKPLGIVFGDFYCAFAADDGDGSVWSFEVPKLTDIGIATPRRSVLGSHASGVSYLQRENRLLIAYRDGALALVEMKVALGEIMKGEQPFFPEFREGPRLELGGRPEGVQVDRMEELCWVNVPVRSEIAVVDLRAQKVLRRIELKVAKQNYPMVLAEKAKRLLVGCREPAKLLVIDIDTDAITGELPLSGDVDDIFVDEERDLVYASCGEGFLDVFTRTDAHEWKLKEKIATAPGARTCLFVPSQKKLFVAVPHRGEQKAEVRVFSTAP